MRILTRAQRWEFIRDMTEADQDAFISHIKVNHPDAFDAAVAAVEQVRAEDMAVTR
jgi:hypothetical protein